MMSKTGWIAGLALAALTTPALAATQGDLIRAAAEAGYCRVSGVASVGTGSTGTAKITCNNPAEAPAGAPANGAFAAGGLGGAAAGGGLLLLLALAGAGGSTTTTTSAGQ
jgi:hypothetical protein